MPAVFQVTASSPSCFQDGASVGAEDAGSREKLSPRKRHKHERQDFLVFPAARPASGHATKLSQTHQTQTQATGRRHTPRKRSLQL